MTFEESPPSFRGMYPSFDRRLTDPGRQHGDGTLAVFLVVFSLFLFIWAPVMLRRCRGDIHNAVTDEVNDLAHFEAQAQAVRDTLEFMSTMNRSYSERRDPHLEYRREFLDNALLTKKVIFQSELDEKVQQSDEVEESFQPGDRKLHKRQKSDVIVIVNAFQQTNKNAETTPAKEGEEISSVHDIETDKEVAEFPETDIETAPKSPEMEESEVEPCSICLTEYGDGDEICWSQNDKCNHFFHKACIQTWLLSHEECPCCRQDFLCLWGDEEQQDGSSRRSPRYTYTQSQQLLSSPNLDWAEELVGEIQQRILQRQRQLRDELEQRNRRQQQLLRLQLQQQLHSLSPSSPTTAVASNLRTVPSGSAVISVDDIAAGLLLYRHFPMYFHSESRRLSRLEQERSNNNGGDDVEVAHFGMPHSLQTYRTNHPMAARPAPRRLPLLGHTGHHHPPPRFFSTAAMGETSTNNRFASAANVSVSTDRTNASAESRSFRETNNDDDEIINA